MDNPHALIIGGSMAGLFAAHLLRTIGWSVDVYERTAGDLAGRGAGLGTSEELFAVMRQIGVVLEPTLRVKVHSHICLDRFGDIACEVPVSHLSSAWDRLYRALKRALPPDCFHAGVGLDTFAQEEHRVTAFFSNGDSARGDLLIAADGVHSVVRQHVLPEIEPRYAGYVAWRGVLVAAEYPAKLKELLSRHMVFCFPEGEQAFSVPLAPADSASSVRVQFVWFRPVDYVNELPELCTDANGIKHGVAIPPPLIRRAVIERLKADAKARLAPQIAELVMRAKQPILQAIYDLESPRMTYGRVAFMGDAAFVARPHVGAGVTKAALDAEALTKALSDSGNDIDVALASYDRLRTAAGKQMVERARYLGSSIGPLLPNSEETRKLRAWRTPEIMMREIGTTAVVDGERIDLS